MPILGVVASSISGNLYKSSFDSIATVTVGAGGQGGISFTSIPSTYTHLQIRGIARSTGATNGENISVYVNNITATTNYAWHVLRGNGTSGQSFGGSGNYIIGNIGVPNASNTFATFVIDILDYTNTNKNKTIKTLYGFDSNGVGVVGMGSVLAPTISAISQIDLFMSYNFAQYSSFALYGIKGVA